MRPGALPGSPAGRGAVYDSRPAHKEHRMASGNRRHLEFFGPDLIRTPPLSGSPPVAAIQIAAGIAQLRTPLLRDDAGIAAHADFIRSLAERLLPDYAVNVRMDAGEKVGDEIAVAIHVDAPENALLHCWLADERGGLVTATPPTSVSWTGGTLLREIAGDVHFEILVPDNGVVTATVEASAATYYLAATRLGRVYWSTALEF